MEMVLSNERHIARVVFFCEMKGRHTSTAVSVSMRAQKYKYICISMYMQLLYLKRFAYYGLFDEDFV